MTHSQGAFSWVGFPGLVAFWRKQARNRVGPDILRNIHILCRADYHSLKADKKTGSKILGCCSSEFKGAITNMACSLIRSLEGDASFAFARHGRCPGRWRRRQAAHGSSARCGLPGLVAALPQAHLGELPRWREWHKTRAIAFKSCQSLQPWGGILQSKAVYCKV